MINKEQKDKNDIIDIAQQIKKYLDKIKFGSITLVIQDGKIVQIESHEKIRFK